eukprot:5704254-Amphidinium_carterae.1
MEHAIVPNSATVSGSAQQNSLENIKCQIRPSPTKKLHAKRQESEKRILHTNTVQKFSNK